jgi:dihydropteroate synthase
VTGNDTASIHHNVLVLSKGYRLLVRCEAAPAGIATALGRALSRSGGRLLPGNGARGRGRLLLLEGTPADLAGAAAAARRHRAGAALADALDAVLGAAERPPRRLRLRRGFLDLTGTRIMGIVNVTPDSFSDGGRFLAAGDAVRHALRLADEGAALLDVGGESTRPGARPVSLAEELRRVLPVLERLVPALRRRGAGRPLVSIDTTKAEVARRAIEAGADLVNDISGASFDPAMPAVVAETGVPIVVQHIRGTPRTMQDAPRYRDLIADVARVLRRRMETLRRAGVAEDRMVVDPGIGFGKTRRDNLVLLRRLHVLRSLGRPILIGASRKSFIGGALELPVGDRLEGSLAAEALAIAGGAAIIRAHDVRAAARVARLCDAVLGGPAGRWQDPWA